MRLAEARLGFAVTAFDHVIAIRVEPVGVPLPDGLVSRHGYDLLVLARQRLADIAAGKPEESCGWVAVHAFDRPEALAVCASRLRYWFQRLGFERPEEVIERQAEYGVRLGPVGVEVRADR